jgi:hypothetical protein
MQEWQAQQLRELEDQIREHRMRALIMLWLVGWIFATGIGIVALATSIAALIPGHVPGIGWWSLGLWIVAALIGYGASWCWRNA